MPSTFHDTTTTLNLSDNDKVENYISTLSPIADSYCDPNMLELPQLSQLQQLSWRSIPVETPHFDFMKTHNDWKLNSNLQCAMKRIDMATSNTFNNRLLQKPKFSCTKPRQRQQVFPNAVKPSIGAPSNENTAECGLNVFTSSEWKRPGSYSCVNCGKLYRWKRNLLAHEKIECGKEPQLQCPYCAHRTKHKSSLVKHVERVHKQPFA